MTEQDSPESKSTPPALAGLTLNPRQRQLHGALTAKNKMAADLYYSALVTLAQPDIPCRLIMAGHALREMVDNLPKFFAIPQPEKPANIKVEVNNLKALWDKCKASKQDAWDGAVGAAEKKFFKKAKKFFDWYSEEHTIRYERNAALVRTLDLSANKLPRRLEEARVQEWQDHYHFFSGVAHLKDDAEFYKWLEALEDYLLNALIPRTFDDFSEIDALLSGGKQ